MDRPGSSRRKLDVDGYVGELHKQVAADQDPVARHLRVLAAEGGVGGGQTVIDGLLDGRAGRVLLGREAPVVRQAEGAVDDGIRLFPVDVEEAQRLRRQELRVGYQIMGRHVAEIQLVQDPRADHG